MKEHRLMKATRQTFPAPAATRTKKMKVRQTTRSGQRHANLRRGPSTGVELVGGRSSSPPSPAKKEKGRLTELLLFRVRLLSPLGVLDHLLELLLLVLAEEAARCPAPPPRPPPRRGDPQRTPAPRQQHLRTTARGGPPPLAVCLHHGGASPRPAVPRRSTPHPPDGAHRPDAHHACPCLCCS